MSDKPEKIYAYPGSLIYSLKPANLTVEYIRADLAKPSERSVKRAYCAGNRTSNIFFESEKDALIYQSSAGAACGVNVWPVDIIPSMLPMGDETP